MKKFLIASGVAVLAFATIAGAQTTQFSANLTVGSTGSDVTALQTWLMAQGFNIPAIASGVASKGYFGAQTAAAVKAYQGTVGLPTTGYFGPLTRAKLNAGGAVVGTGTTVMCPVGYVCTPTVGTTPVVTSPTGISTVGIPGTLVYALQSTYNNSSLDKGKSVDVARYKLQASASDMQVTSLSFDFDKRIWLYVGSVTIKDDNGTVIASKSGLTVSDFSELTVGSSYRLTVPVSYVVPRATSKYLTVNLTALSVTDRTASETINITSSQARAVDGTGVNDTETDGTDRSISWTGSSNAAIVTTIDSSSPATKLVQISSSVETDNVTLGIFDIKSQNTDTTLRTLKVGVKSTGNTVSALFNDIKVKINGTTYSADEINTSSPNTTSSSTVTFTNLNITLPKDVYVPVTVMAKVAKNVSGSASTTLIANAANIVVEDSSYASVSVTAATIAANSQTFTVSGVAIPSLSTTYGTKTCSTDLTTCVQSFTFTFSLTAGDSPIYVSKNVFTALSTSSTPAGFTITKQDFSDSDTSGDGTTYFYIASRCT
jgi:hypothetical protein